MFEIKIEKFYPNEEDKECFVELREPSHSDNLIYLDMKSKLNLVTKSESDVNQKKVF